MFNFTATSSTSTADAFKNLPDKSFSSTIATQSLSAGGFISSIASTALSNSNSISQVQLMYSGLETFYRVINGAFVGNYDSGTYQIQSFYYFDSTNLYVQTIIANQTGSAITIPAITVKCRAFLFLAPF